MKVLLASLFSVAALNAQGAFDSKQPLWNQIVSSHVKDGVVDYAIQSIPSGTYSYVKKFLPAAVPAKIKSPPGIEFLDYDWSLSSKAGKLN